MDHLVDDDYPAQIKGLRTRLGLTQAALAKALGVSSPTINRWEKGKSRPSQLSWNQILNLAGDLEPEPVVELEAPSRRTPFRCELLKWFRASAAPLAEAYEGAARLVDDGDFPGRIHFIAHAVRDICDRLVYVLDPQLKAGRVQYENGLDRIEKLWPHLKSVGETSHAAAATEVVHIDQKLAFMINSLVSEHRERRQRPSNSELLFRFLMRKEPLQAAVNQRLVRDFARMRDWFMELTHVRREKVPAVDESELQIQFKKFEGMLHSFVGSFFTGKKELDEILRRANQ